MTVDQDAEVANILAWFARKTSAEKADLSRRDPDLYGAVTRLTAGARYVITYAD